MTVASAARRAHLSRVDVSASSVTGIGGLRWCRARMTPSGLCSYRLTTCRAPVSVCQLRQPRSLTARGFRGVTTTRSDMNDHTLHRLGMRGHDARLGHWISGRHARGHWLVSWSGEAWEVWYALDARIYRTTHHDKREACWAVHARTARMIADEPQWEDER